MATWKDTTSYRRGETQEPSCWTLTGQELRVSVLTGHRMADPDDWVMNCYQFNIEARKIGTKADMTEAQAKHKALQIVKNRANRLIADIDEATP